MLDDTSLRQRNVVKKSDSDLSSDSSTPPSSLLHSTSDPSLSDVDKKKDMEVPRRTLSLKERSRIPYSFYVSVSSTILLQYCSGMWNMQTLSSLLQSYKDSAMAAKDLVIHAYSVLANPTDSKQLAQTIIVLACVSLLAYVFVIAPARHGVWTTPKARKHKTHRYMGLVFLIQYALAWVEFATNYVDKNGVAGSSYIPHFVALNGVIQSTSAYFSFKVLPELEDPGYYSDKAVVSRSFVHENIYFALFCIFGSVFYHPLHRHKLKEHPIGHVVELIYVFWPYILVRPWFPVTRFSNAGTGRSGRSKTNERWYQIGTYMVKIFYLWAKYFLGFYINFLVYMNKVTDKQWHLIHGMFLLNVGTVSLAIFLHTLRFKKILPPKFTFSLYLIQIYLTFSAIPLAFDMFATHGKLCLLAVSGVAANMTRSRPIHGVWCAFAMYMITQTRIDW